MSARLTARLPALVTIFVGAGFMLGALGTTTVGCGSKTEEAPAETGVVIVDSTSPDTRPVDTGTAPVDSEMQYDVPGSLFDATIPDVVFEGGKTAQGCYDCTTDKCKAQLQECDKDARCRGVLLCVLVDCAGKFTDQACVIGCAFGFGVMSLSDPIVGKLQTVAACNQSNCADVCPAAPGDAGPAPDTKPAADAADSAIADSTATDSATADTNTDARTDAADAKSDSETGAMMGNAFQIQKETFMPNKLQSVDPAVVDVLLEVSTSFGHPAVRQGVIDHLNH